MYSISCPILYPIQSKPQTKLNQFLVETLRTVFRILHTPHTPHKLSISAYDVLLLITQNLLLLAITLLLNDTLHLTFQPSRFCCFASPVILNPSPCPVLSPSNTYYYHSFLRHVSDFTREEDKRTKTETKATEEKRSPLISN